MTNLIENSFIFLRHGETDWNKEGRYQGQKDIPLNSTGLAQAEIARDRLANQTISTVHSSSLSRALKTAEIVNSRLDVPLFVHTSLCECHYGELEGQLKSDPTIDQRWREGDTPAGAESYTEFSARIITALNKILSSKGTALVVAHRAVFWPISEAIGFDVNSNLSNAQPLLLQAPNLEHKAWKIIEIS
ncbi:MAG: histidine phosphatase family protein [Halopseudomonas aestusnigri]